MPATPRYRESGPAARFGAPSEAAYPVDTTAMLLKLERDYRASGLDALPISFRELVPWIRGERATHYLHSYPAKLLPQIAHFFLAASGWLPPEALVLDPFCGSGTVILEAHLSGRPAVYADVNPLARLVTSVKARSINGLRSAEALLQIRACFDERAHSDRSAPWVVNIDLWYDHAAKSDLCKLHHAISTVTDDSVRDLAWVTLSTTARRCSRADNRFSVPVRSKKAQAGTQASPRVWAAFEEQYRANLQRHDALTRLAPWTASLTCAGTDARELRTLHAGAPERGDRLESNTVDFVLTSPPYAGAQKYIRASSLGLGWLGLTTPNTLKSLENNSIGREHFLKHDISDLPETGLDEADALISALALVNPMRAAICAYYLVEMDEAIKEIARVLKPGSSGVIVIGENTVCGRHLASVNFLSEMLTRRGLTARFKLLDAIRSRGLLTKRSGGAAAIPTETALVFTK